MVEIRAQLATVCGFNTMLVISTDNQFVSNQISFRADTCHFLVGRVRLNCAEPEITADMQYGFDQVLPVIQRCN